MIKMKKLFYDDFMMFLQESIQLTEEIYEDKIEYGESFSKEVCKAEIESIKITERILKNLYGDFEKRYSNSKHSIYDGHVANQILNTFSSYVNFMHMSDKEETPYNMKINKQLRSLVNNLWRVYHEVEE